MLEFQPIIKLLLNKILITKHKSLTKPSTFLNQAKTINIQTLFKAWARINGTKIIAMNISNKANYLE